MNKPTMLTRRLPLTYGAIALLTTLTLGVVLLFGLSRYYLLQERRYLLTNAQAVGGIVESAETAVLNSDLLQPQIDALSSLIQARIQIYSGDSLLLADSGLPQQNEAATTLTLRVEAGDLAQEFSQTTHGADNSQQVTSVTAVDDGETQIKTTTTIEQEGLGLFTTPLAILETPFSFGLGATDPNARSSQVVRYPVLTPSDELIGVVQLSEGPAFGRPVLVSVAWGILLAGGIAVGIATLVGWQISRRLTAPLTELAQVAQRMAHGDLAARARVARQDEIGELATAYNEMAEQLTGLIETLRHFVADAAHELRTPLTALRTNLELAMQQPENGRFLQSAQTQLQRVQSLTNDLLALSLLENPHELLDKRRIDFTALLQSQSERYAAQAEQANVALTFCLPDSPLMIDGSAPHVQRTLDNLLDNAFKFGQGGTVEVALQADGSAAVLTVTDSGIGIPEPIDRVFARFYRAANANPYPGSGLGLAITKAIVEAHDGRIHAANTAAGTRFTLHLPLSPNHTA